LSFYSKDIFTIGTLFFSLMLLVAEFLWLHQYLLSFSGLPQTMCYLYDLFTISKCIKKL